MKLSILYTAPKTMTYDFIEEQFAKEFKEDPMRAKFIRQGFTDVKFKRVKKSSYKVAGVRRSVHLHVFLRKGMGKNGRRIA